MSRAAKNAEELIALVRELAREHLGAYVQDGELLQGLPQGSPLDERVQAFACALVARADCALQTAPEPSWWAAALNRRASIEQLMFDAVNGKRPMPSPDELRAWALKLGTPADGEPSSAPAGTTGTVPPEPWEPTEGELAVQQFLQQTFELTTPEDGFDRPEAWDEKPFARIRWYEDGGDQSVGIPGWRGFVLADDQTNTVVGDMLASTTRQEPLSRGVDRGGEK